MRIAYIATSNIPSAAANSIQVMKVCQALKLNGDEPHLFIPGRGELNWDELKRQYGLAVQFQISRIPSIKFFRRFDFIYKALRAARRARAEVVYTRMLWVARFAQLQRMPVILELHDVPAGRFGRRTFDAYLHSPSRTKTVLITHALGRVIEDRFKLSIPESARIVAPDGVDLERYQNLPDPAQARKALGLKESLTAVYTGGFYKGRGLELLLELAKAFPQVEFLWVGGRPDAVTEWQTVLQSQAIRNIRLTGFVPNEELPQYQAAADILLMPFARSVSGSSGGNTADVCSPMKMFEYMAAGRATLTSDLPVLREVLNESNALFYTPEDFADLKEKFALLVGDNRLRGRIAEQARKDVLQYSWQERMRKILTSF